MPSRAIAKIAGKVPTGNNRRHALAGNCRRVLTVLLVALVTLVSGCEPDDGNSPALDGTEWRLTAWSGSSLEPSRFTITAAFDDSHISGISAVNSYGGTYLATRSGDFSVREVQSTLMAGTDEAMQAEQYYIALLGKARKYTINGTTLTLFGDGDHAALVFARN